MKTIQGRGTNGGQGTQSEYSRTLALVERVLGDPDLYPGAFRSWLTRFLYGNVNFSVTQGQLPAIEKPHLVGASGEVAFQNSWVNFGGTNASASYYKDSLGRVYLKGTIKTGASGTTAFTLPAGYRPQEAEIFPVVANGAFGLVTVNPDGTVVVSTGSSTYTTLSGINYRAFA